MLFICTCLQAFSLAFTQLRSLFDENVVSPRFLDVGFFIAFAMLTFLSIIDDDVSHIIHVWCNVIMMGITSLLFILGCVYDVPFILPYAIESGLPKVVGEDPFLVHELGKLSMEWAWLMLAVTLVSAVAPFYRCFIDGSSGSFCFADKTDSFELLNTIFTGYVQTALFVWMGYKGVFVDAQKRKDQEEWATREESEIRNDHGVPLEGCKVSGKLVRLMQSVPPIASGNGPNKDTEYQIAKCVNVCARAFVDDPLILKWRNLGDIEQQGDRIQAMKPVFDVMVRACMALNHCFTVDEISYCLCVPSWPRGDESDIFLSYPMIGAMIRGIPISLPPVEVSRLRDATKAALGGRQHLYIATFATDPDHHGEGD